MWKYITSAGVETVKIGIVTFFRSLNYGAMLQAYALWKTLESEGHEVEFIRHSHSTLLAGRLSRCFWARTPKSFISKIRHWLRYSLNQDVTNFALAYPQTEPLSRKEDFVKRCATYHAAIVGSDQMWNPRWVVPCGFLPIVFLDFVQAGCRRISYAVSFSERSWGDKCRDQAADLMRKFNQISVRERSGVDIVKQVSGCKAELVLDPTLLHKDEFYRRLMHYETGLPSGYAFVYMINDWSWTKAESDSVGFCLSGWGIECHVDDTVVMGGWVDLLLKVFGERKKVQVPVWLSRLAGASAVLTNSFHGMVFAILFHKPFVVFRLRGEKSGMNERVESLLSRLNLNSRCVDIGNFDAMKDAISGCIDWASVDSRLEIDRSVSLNFIRRSLGNV